MDLRQLDSFRHVVREGSFTAAAKRLHMTQPAISLHIKALEQELGARLMERDGKGVRLTPEGEALLEAADRAFAALEAGRRALHQRSAPDRGTVVLACGDTVALHLLPPVLKAFRRAWPKAEVAILNHGSQEILERVLRREADVGIVTRPPRLDPELWSRTLRQDPLRLVLPRRHPLAEREAVSREDLEGRAAVLLARPAETRAVIDRALREVGVEPRCVMESGNLEVVKRYVREGLGWSIVPEMALGPADLKRLVVRDLPGLPARRIVVVRRKDRAPGPLTTALLELMARHLLDGGPSAS